MRTPSRGTIPSCSHQKTRDRQRTLLGLSSCWASWCRPRQESGSPTRRADAPRVTLGPGEVLVGHQAISVTVVGTPPGPADNAIRPCTGHHSTRTARPSTDQRRFGSPTLRDRLGVSSSPPHGLDRRNAEQAHDLARCPHRGRSVCHLAPRGKRARQLGPRNRLAKPSQILRFLAFMPLDAIKMRFSHRK